MVSFSIFQRSFKNNHYKLNFPRKCQHWLQEQFSLWSRRNKWSAEKENILKACENHETRRRFLLHQILKLTELSLSPNKMHSKFVLRKKSVIRTIFKMIADGMNNAQNEWVCNITERFRERTMFCNFFLLFFSLAQSHLTFRSTSRL